MHSWVRSQERNVVIGGSPFSGSSFQAASETAAIGLAVQAGRLRSGGSTPWVSQHRGDELAEDDRLVVGDEVGLARPALLGGQHHSLDHVVDVGGVGDVAAAADPGPAAFLDRRDHLREQGRVALAPDETGPDRDGLESARDWRAEPRARPAPWSPGRAPASRVGAAPSSSTWTSGSPAISAASVPQWTKRRTPAAAAALNAFSVPLDVAALEVLPRTPLAEVGGEVEGDIGARGARLERLPVGEVAAHRLGAAIGHRAGPRRRIGPGPAPPSRRGPAGRSGGRR